MLLTIDIGNTTTEWGLFNLDKPDDYHLIDSFRLATFRESSSDEFILKLDYSLQLVGVTRRQIQAIICSSVVPSLDHVISKMGEKYFNTQPFFVHYQNQMDITIQYQNPKEIGADRLVVANAVYHFYGAPCIALDFGTATTVCTINHQGVYQPGVIIPGVKTSLENLISKASKLPPIELAPVNSVLGQTTMENMQAGIYLYTIYGIEGFVRRIKSEILGPNAKVIATGGLANYIASGTSCIDSVDNYLILKGLKRWYHLNRS